MDGAGSDSRGPRRRWAQAVRYRRLVKMAANDDIFEIDLLRSLGLSNLRFLAEIPHGGGAACGMIAAAVAAITSGMADVAR